jgi:hypothetical protein
MHPELSPVVSHIRFDEHSRAHHTRTAARVSRDHRFFRRRRWATAPPGSTAADVVDLGSRESRPHLTGSGERVA